MKRCDWSVGGLLFHLDPVAHDSGILSYLEPVGAHYLKLRNAVVGNEVMAGFSLESVD